MKQDYAKKDKELTTMATKIHGTIAVFTPMPDGMKSIYTTEEYLEDIGYNSVRDKTLPDNLLEPFKDTVCTAESDERTGDAIWTALRKPVGRID